MAYQYECVAPAKVEQKEGKKPYKMAVLAYRDDKGELREKKIMSFVNGDVYKLVTELKAGDTFYVEQEKQGEYWVWTHVSLTGTSSAGASSGPAGEGAGASRAVSGAPSSYATDQAEKQKSIVRQTALKAAVEFVGENDVDIPDVLKTAEEFEAWINRE